MRIVFILPFCLFLFTCQNQQKSDFVLVIHGGAGTIKRDKMTPERETAIRAAMQEALSAGYQILSQKGSSLDAVEAAVVILENSPEFNAGKGAVFTHEGTNELDASIMDGATLNAGAITGVKHIKNPIKLARLVMDSSKHVFFSGKGAEAFAGEQNVEMVDQDYFYTKRRWESLQKALKKENSATAEFSDSKFGTVGAVALDAHGHLAAATSTGGMTNKRYGRIGDSPVIGAGTYANNATCAVSATGHGEYFIRNMVAHEISALMQHATLTVLQAAKKSLENVQKMGGTGGVIAIDNNGNVAMPFNTAGMYRGTVRKNGEIEIKFYGD